eukprot:6666280-Pyramimonas_sp.AAC.1
MLGLGASSARGQDDFSPAIHSGEDFQRASSTNYSSAGGGGGPGGPLFYRAPSGRNAITSY